MGIPTLPGFSTFLIPLTTTPQTFQIALAGVNYNMTVRWNDASDGGWVMDIADSNNNPLVNGVPLITGLDCLDGLSYLGINGQMIVYTDGDDSAVPTFTNLGVESNLYFLTTAPNG